MKERQKRGIRQWHYLAIMAMCSVNVWGAGGAVPKPSAKRTSLSEAELRTFATSVPDVKNAGALYSVAMATSNDVEAKQEYLKAAAACLVASGREDVYRKRVKSRLSNAEEVEGELKGDCSRCAGTGAKERRCPVCQGKEKCPTCKGSGQVVSVGFDGQNGSRSCRKCNGGGRCSKCDGAGSTKEKCTACAGIGKTFSRSVAARVFRDLCIALADSVGSCMNGKEDGRMAQKKGVEEALVGGNEIAKNTKVRANPNADCCRRSTIYTSSVPIKDGFGTETIGGATYSYEINNGEATIGMGGGFIAAVKNELEGRLIVPSVLGGAPVTRIGFAAFYKTKSSEIVLPDSVVTIGSSAFCMAKASHIVIPSSVRSIAHDALEDSTWYKRQRNGPLYLDNIFFGFKGRDSTEGSFSVKEGTRVIASDAFCIADFSAVTLPDSVCHIGEGAFSGCSKKLTRITVPRHLVSIGEGAFTGCRALVTDLIFPEGLREIGGYAFAGCSKIERISLPLSLESMGGDAFGRCPVKSMTLPPLFATTNNRGNAVFQLPHTLESVKLIGEWTHIPGNMFSSQRELKKIELVGGIKEIGTEAFKYCEALEEIQIPDAVISIGNSAFSNCKKLRKVKLPRQLKCIKENLFSHCSSLEAVVIPLGVTDVGCSAFYDCPSLKTISIPDSVSSIADSAFDETCHIEKSDKRRAADHLAVVQREKASFLKNCTAEGEMAQVEYYDVVYAIVKNTLGDDNFVVMSCSDNPNGAAYALMIFPTRNSREQWYTAVGKCTEKIKSWIRISAENKVKYVSKEIPVYGLGGSEAVYACVDAITRGRGAADLMRKAVREPVMLSRLHPSTQLVKFVGTVEANDNTFEKYRVSIRMICGDFFARTVFSEDGTVEEIENEIVKLLTFVNPKSLEDVRNAQSKKEALFN